MAKLPTIFRIGLILATAGLLLYFICANNTSKDMLTKSTSPIYINDFEILEDTSTTVAKQLEKKIKVLCWIAVTNTTIERAMVIKKTWGSRCTKLLLIGDTGTKNADIINISVNEGRQNLWPKTREAFKYVYKNHYNDADWFLKADTDSYVIMENLRHLLSQQDVEKPAYLGCHIRLYLKEGYNSGGAGYILNKVSLKKLVETGFQDSSCNKGYSPDEDVSMGYCMETIKVPPGETADEKGQPRFFPFEPFDHVFPGPPGNNHWYWDLVKHAGPKNMSCCSETLVSFHYVDMKLLWNMEFLLYHTKLFGVDTTYKIENKKDTSSPKKSNTEIPH